MRSFRVCRTLAAVLPALSLALACRSAEDAHRDPREVSVAARAIAAEDPIPLAVSSDGARVLLQARTETGFRLVVWDRRTRAAAQQLATRGRPRLTAWSPDGRMIAFYEDTGRTRYGLRIWDIAAGSVIRPATPVTRIVTQSTWAPNSSRLSAVQELPDDSRDLYSTTPTPNDSAHLLLADLSAKAGIAWAPDGRSVATVAAKDSGAVTVIASSSATPRRYPVAAGGEVRDLAWSQRGDALLATVRAAGDKSFGLARVSLPSGAVERIAIPDGGDVSAPLFLPDGRGFVFRQARGADKLTIACDVRGRGCHTIGPSSGQAVPWAIHPTGDTVYLSRLLPRQILAADVPTGGSLVAYASAERSGLPGNGRVDIASWDGLKIPLYIQPARRRSNQPRSIFIQVLGAIGKESPPPWDSRTDYLASAGIDVMKVNYRGKAGFGPELLKAPGGDSGRVRDVLAAWRYVVDTLGIAPSRTVLFGHSDGAVLVAEAALLEPRIGTVMLSSMLRSDRDLDTPPPRRRCVLAFHGELDPLGPQIARRQIEKTLGRGATDESCGHFQVLPREAHEIERAESWAEIYADAVTALRSAR